MRSAPPPGIGRHVAQALNPAALADPEMPVAAVPVDDRIDPKTVGLHDAVESGWFRFDKGELLDGFPVGVGDIVLDAGCGNGAYSATCVRMGAEVIAVDINPGNLAEATRRVAEVDGGAPFTPLVGDCARLPLADGSITTVIALDLLEFADDPLAVLQELNRVGGQEPAIFWQYRTPCRRKPCARSRRPSYSPRRTTANTLSVASRAGSCTLSAAMSSSGW